MASAFRTGSAKDGNGGTSDQLTEALERHRAFWLHAETDCPIARVIPWQEHQTYAPFVRRDGTPLPDGAEILPGLLDRLATLEPYRPHDLLDGDFLSGWGPYDNCWTEALLGCAVLRTGPSVGTKPFIQGWDQAGNLSGRGSGAWLDELLSINQVLVAQTKGLYPVCQPLMRGPLDMIEAAMPPGMLFSAFYEHPAPLRMLLDHCADIFITTANRWLAETPPFHGGYVVRSEWGLWAPGSTVQFQQDAMVNLSPEMYRDFMFEIDRRIASEFEYPIIHTHSGSAHILPVLADEPALLAIEVALDPAPYGPPPLDLLPQFQMVQQAGKSLFIDGPMKRSELDSFLEVLSPAGLALQVGLLPE